MNFGRVRSLLVLLIALGLGNSVWGDSPASSDSGDVQDLLLLGPTHPLRIRLHIETNGVPYRDVWRKAIEIGFDRFDRGKTGKINAEQANRLFAMFAAGTLPDSDSAADAVKNVMEMMKGTRPVTREDVIARLTKTSPPLTVRNRLASRGAGPALFSLLDSDGDGRVSRDELKAAEQNLACRDFNDDGMITAEELLLGPSSAGPGRKDAVSAGTAAMDGPVIAMTASTSPESLVDAIVYRYDRNRDGKLSFGPPPVEIRSPGDAFARFDANHDQMLDRVELAALLQAPPDIEMYFSFGKPSAASRSAASRTANNAAAAYHMRRKLDGGYRLTIAENEIDFRRNNRDPAQSNQGPNFSDYDSNKDGALSADELSSAGMGANLKLMDTDGDGKVTADEFDAYFRWQGELAGSQLVLEVTDEGQDLFSLIDRNGDGFLSPRELKTATEVLIAEDTDHDGFLTSGDIPYHAMLELSRSSPNAAAANAPASAARQPRKSKAAAVAPEWFIKMDRNGDGEISPAEFLGSREQFDRLDANRDGLIDPAEVASAQ